MADVGREWCRLGLVGLGAGALLAACGGGSGDAAHDGNPAQSVPTPRGWELLWADEFDGSALNSRYWNIQIGDGTAEGIPGWGNDELQSYQAANVSVADGHLVINAREEAAGDLAYTSGRVNTAGHVAVRYGRIEASIRVPTGQGLWPAFWMLPENSPYGSWASSGEIDIMEVYTRSPSPFTQGVVHHGMAWPLNVFTVGRYSGIDPADGFHTYAVEWDAEQIRWFVDGVHFHTVGRNAYWSYYKNPATNAHVAAPESAPFDQPFHILLNLAVGGNLPGDPTPGALPGEMRVDYVRVYQCNIDTATGVGCADLANLVDSSVVPAPPSDVYCARYDLYADAVGPLVFPDTEETVALRFGVDDNNGALRLSEVDRERGRVIDVDTTGGGSFSIHATDLSRHRFFGMGSAAEAASFAGELQFDLYVFGAATDLNSGLKVKLDSGFPDLGFVELAIADLRTDEWTTVTAQISDIAHNSCDFGGGPVDLSRVLSLFVLEPTGAAHLQVDNIRILCAHPSPGGCGIAPPA